MSEIGKKIKQLRKERGWTQEQLANQSGLHRVSIAQIELGIRKDPDLSSRKKLAKAFGMEIVDLLD